MVIHPREGPELHVQLWMRMGAGPHAAQHVFKNGRDIPLDRAHAPGFFFCCRCCSSLLRSSCSCLRSFSITFSMRLSVGWLARSFFKSSRLDSVLSMASVSTKR